MERATANVIAAARLVGATIVFPGNIYNLGNHPEHPLAEDAPNDPCSRKGALRAQLEDSLRQASGEGVRVLIVRAGNYFGPTVRNGLVDPLFGNAAKGKGMLAFGGTDRAQQWAYVPDLARAAVDLFERSASLEPCQVVNFAGVVFKPVGDLYRQTARVVGKPNLAIRVMPWWLLRLVGLFDGVVRELMEMRYLWDNAIILDGALMKRLLPDFQPTALDEALAATVRSYGA
jgi:nucleoside-diphosphate-sugar epimerase